jgi:carbonic anhydrase/acetyltransferase-like protein (isoleucine patch superfamily)
MAIDPWVRLLRYRDLAPYVDESVFVALHVVIEGDVTIGPHSSIWYNSTIRGDVNSITIGCDTNIQDNSILHVAHETHPLLVGDRVTCGHAVRLHGCTIQDECLIGIGAIILDGAIVETGAIVAAGALVAPGTVVKGGTVIAGVPARVLREVSTDERTGISESASHYVEYARITRESLRAEWR